MFAQCEGLIAPRQDYLAGVGRFSDRAQFPFPDLLLLDLDMPHVNGLEVLAWLRSQKFPQLRTVVLSATPDPAKIASSLELGADYFQVKMSDTNDIRAFMHRLELLMVMLDTRDQISLQNENFMKSNTLTIIDGRSPPAEAQMLEVANTKRNFLLILRAEQELEKLWAVLGTTTTMPGRLDRWGVLAMADAVSEDGYRLLLDVYAANAVYLIEQLVLTRTVPPRTLPIVLYCEMRGIISEHTTVEEAGLSLLEYLARFDRARLLPLAGIYEYRDAKWQRVKKLTSDSPSNPKPHAHQRRDLDGSPWVA